MTNITPLCDHLVPLDSVCLECGEMSEWISVKDRLPAYDGRYLVTGGGETVITRFYSKTGVPHFYYTDTTHWMPLPEPPK